jgi:hypothetical protein
MYRLLPALLLLLPGQAYPGWGDLLEFFNDNESAGITASTLSDTEIIDGLKAALGEGADKAIAALGRDNGYYGDPDVKIPVPQSLEAIRKGLKTLGRQQLVEDFEVTLNRAAEQAVPAASAIFVDTIREMSIVDARNILYGPDNAASEYFRDKSGDKITERFSPIVADATDRVGVTSRYKSLIAELGPLAKWIDMDAVDLDRYITDQAVDGLFLKIAEQEKRIRENPAARTSEILKKVFR